jgi:hypothetical protein
LIGKANQEFLISKVKQYLASGDLNFTQEEVHFTVASFLFNTGLFGYPMGPWTDCKTWFLMQMDEIFRQGDIEKEQKMTFSASTHGRTKSDVAKIELDFLNFDCLPLCHSHFGDFSHSQPSHGPFQRKSSVVERRVEKVNIFQSSINKKVLIRKSLQIYH